MGKLLHWVWDKMAGAGLWRIVDMLWGAKWQVGVAMIVTTIAVVRGIIEALPGSVLFVTSLGAFGFTLFIVNQIQLRMTRGSRSGESNPLKLPYHYRKSLPRDHRKSLL